MVNGASKLGHVLVFNEYGWRNGGENSWLAVAPQLQKLGWQFTVACPQTSELAEFVQQREILVVDWNVFDSDNIRKSQEQIRSELRALIVEICPRLVHANSLATSRLLGPVASALKIPAIGYLRDIIKVSAKAMSDINTNTTLVAVSQATATFHCSRGLDGSHVCVNHNGIDTVEFAPRPPTGYIHRELNIPKHNRLLVCIGQIGIRKGTDVVIDAFLKLASKRDDLHLLIVGMRNSVKSESIEFEQKCRQRGVLTGDDHRIHWLGRRTDIAHLLNETTLVLHGARQEPLGRVLLESAACGCPFIATSVGGTPEIVQALEGSQLTCRVDCPDEMAAKAEYFLDHCQRYLALAMQLRKVATESFSAQRSAENLHRIYCSAIESVQNTAGP